MHELQMVWYSCQGFTLSQKVTHFAICNMFPVSLFLRFLLHSILIAFAIKCIYNFQTSTSYVPRLSENAQKLSWSNL